MTSVKGVAGGVIIDGKRIPAETVTGKILKQRDTYFLQLRGRKLEIPLGPLAGETDVAKLTGEEVNVALSRHPKPSVIAIGTWPTPERPKVPRIVGILCYVPAPDLRRKLDAGMQKLLLRSLAR